LSQALPSNEHLLISLLQSSISPSTRVTIFSEAKCTRPSQPGATTSASPKTRRRLA
jgi:hypothetical protein